HVAQLSTKNKPLPVSCSRKTWVLMLPRLCAELPWGPNMNNLANCSTNCVSGIEYAQSINLSYQDVDLPTIRDCRFKFIKRLGII
ncbi:MAG: hypothetical protein KDJ52_27750, partial [Anaerolineae bacterium]|nr:hypothetical protein [Anaerolineae bacterium]